MVTPPRTILAIQWALVSLDGMFDRRSFPLVAKGSRCHIPQSPIVLASAGHLGLSLTVRLTLSSMFQRLRAIRFKSERPMGLCDYFLFFFFF